MSPSHVLLRLMQLLPPLLLLISAHLPTALSAATCNPDDKRALLQLKAALGDPRTLFTWTADTDCCTQWFAITGCDSGTGRVTTVHIAESDAAGSLPPSIGHLPYLGRRTYYCDKCNEQRQGFSFYCEECDFDLDPNCALKVQEEAKEADGDGNPMEEDDETVEGYVCDGGVCYKK